MSNDSRFQTTNKPSITRYSSGGSNVSDDTKNAIRVYSNSPETIALQIRGEKSYATVSLTYADAAVLQKVLADVFLHRWPEG